MSLENPKVFISYSWSSKTHKQWVLDLATDLRDSGVDVVLDRWHLKEGQDKYPFMEQMVNDPEVVRVLMVCDRAYQEKANVRKGGAGEEALIISAKIYKDAQQEKFIPIIREMDENGDACVPTFAEGRMYIDFRDDDLYPQALEQLLRNIFGEPELPIPPWAQNRNLLKWRMAMADALRFCLPLPNPVIAATGQANGQHCRPIWMSCSPHCET